MRDVGFKVKEAFRFLYRSKSKYRIHSPFVFEFVTRCIENKGLNDNRLFSDLKQLRRGLKNDSALIVVKDYGARGNRTGLEKAIRIGEIYKNAVSPHWKSAVFFRIVRFYGFSEVLELGSSLGVNACYLKAAAYRGNYVGVEGSRTLAEHAQKMLGNRFDTGFKVVTSEIGAFLSKLKMDWPQPVFVYIDGNHSGSAIKDYTQRLASALPEGSFVVLDDIRWSAEMFSAWKELSVDRQFNVSLDLFQFGALVKRKGVKKQHFEVFSGALAREVLTGG